MAEPTKGVCIIAYNNNQLDYIQFASLAAAYVKTHMKNNNVTLLTDQGTSDWMETSVPETLQEACFDQVVVQDIIHEDNPRKHMDSPWTEFNAQFSNKNKNNVVNITPYDKTLLIDSDYYIMNDFYDYLFDSDISVGLHRDAIYLEGQMPYLNEIQLNEGGIHHWWSTAVYFDKNNYESQIFFDIWAHVKENWDYYALLYQFPPALFRTDFCVSIACHMMNGFNNGSFVHDFGGVPLLNMDQKDDIVEVKSVDDWIMLSHDRKEPWKNILTRLEKQNIHAMNKRAVSRNSKDMWKHIGKMLNV
tara:strand:+ start:8526 stop:9434 length:909 start_codon:yes stop_codon:yes gene_type:complete